MVQLTRQLTRISVLMLALCIMFSSMIPTSAAEISGFDAVSVSEGTEDVSKGTITSSLNTGKSDTKEHEKTMTLTGDSEVLGSAVGTLTFKVTYSLSANDVTLGTDGKASISASSGITSASVNPGSKTEENIAVTIENWKAGSMWTVTMTASASSNVIGGKTASSVSVTISEITFTEYLKESVTFTGAEKEYTVTYYADASTTTTSSVTIPANSEGVNVEAALVRGMSVSASDYYYCTDVQADRSGTTITLVNGPSFVPQSGDVITPTFYQDWDKDGSSPFLVNGASCWNWEQALAVAGSNGTIVLNEDYTFAAGTYTVPNGVTFVAPYSANDFSVDSKTETVEGGMNSTLEHANKKLVIANKDDMLLPDSKVTYTLTIPSDVTVNVASGGRFVVGGTICSGHDSYIGIVGGTAGAHSNVQLEGKLNVSGIVSSCGYILGDGQMNVASDGTVYQPYITLDHRNGQYAVGTTTGDDGITPWNRFALMNIQCKVHMEYGAYMNGYVDMYTAALVLVEGILELPERHTVACETIIGPSDGIYNMTSADGSVDVSYDADRYVDDNTHNGLYPRVGTTTIEFNGNTSLGFMEITLNVGGTNYKVSTNTDYFPVAYNFQIHQNSGMFTVANKMKLQPGALLHIHENAALNVTSQLAVMDGFSDHCDISHATSSPDTYARYRYPTADVLEKAPFSGSGTAQLIVDGTMTVAGGGAFGGVVQTNGTGRVEMNGTSGVTVVCGPRSQEKVVGTTANISGRTVYSLSPRLYITGENKTLEMETGKAYSAIDAEPHKISDFDFVLHTTASDNSKTELVENVPLNATVIGTWQCATEEQHSWSDATCTAPKTCSVCGATEGEKLGHSYGDPSKVWEGTKLTVTLTCSKCADGTEDRVLSGSAEGTQESSNAGDCKTRSTTTYTATVTLNGQDYSDKTTITGEYGDHTYGDLIEELPEVHTKDELKAGVAAHYQCSVCKGYFDAEKKQTSIESLTGETPAHTPAEAVIENKKDATCGEAGSYDSVVYCSVEGCGKELSREKKTIDATGNHNYAIEVENTRTPATCMAAGTVTMKCACGAEKVQTLAIDKDNHTGNTHIENKAEPTCGAEGYTGDAVCECGVTVGNGTTIPATGNHNYVAEVEGTKVPATCMATGTVTMKCGCGAEATVTLAIDTNAHSWDNACDTDCNNGCGTTREITHYYVDGVCDVCGDVKTVNIQIINRGNTLLLEGMVSIRQYVAFRDESGKDYSVEYVLQYGGIEVTDIYGNVSNKSLVSAGTYQGYREYTYTTDGIVARDMDRKFVFRPYLTIDGTKIYSDPIEYGVQTYAHKVFTGTSTDEKLKATVASLLNYGAAAQNYFDGRNGYEKPDILMNKCLGEYVAAGQLNASYAEIMWDDGFIDALDTPAEEMTVNFPNTGTLIDNGSTLVIEGAISVNYYWGIGNNDSNFKNCTKTMYFWTEDQYNKLKAEGTPLSVDNALVKVNTEAFSYSQKYGYECMFTSDQVFAKNMGDTIYSALVIVDDNGKEHCTGVITYSPEYYAYNVLHDNKTNTLDDFVKAMVVYGERAKIKFAKS